MNHEQQPQPDFQREAEKSINPNPLYDYLITQQQYEFAEQVRFISLASQISAGEVEELRRENERLKTVMIAAAEEIKLHWDAHCDEEGYGPTGLLYRLERGIPSQYGYTAGGFAELTKENEELREQVRKLREGLQELFEQYESECKNYADGEDVPLEKWVENLPTYQKAKQLLKETEG